MGRGMGKDDTIALIDRIADKLPGAALRSTFIVGYPGESDAQFAELLDFVREGRFMHAGVFTYSREVNTRAGRAADTVSAEEKSRRADALMEAQLDVSCRRLAEMIGQDTEVMIDSFEEDEQQGLVAVGHTQGQEIDVDGACFIEGPAARLRRLQAGDRVPVRITDAGDYDLIGELRDE
jgi:ribosomal protein S12 methylthiotransferase